MQVTLTLLLSRLKSILRIVCVLLGVAFLTLFERKCLAAIQRRVGPNTVGMYGIFTPLADGLKLRLKKVIFPIAIEDWVFRLAPLITFITAILSWAVIPIGNGKVFADLNCGLIYRLGSSSLGVYGILLSGWSSNSKYAFIGSLRSTSQILAYEVSIGFVISTIIRYSQSSNRTDIVHSQLGQWNLVPNIVIMAVFYISTLAETNRHPFDLPEAEAELVSGYNVEYSGVAFTLFFLGEYSNMLRRCCLSVTMFFGGWNTVLNIPILEPFIVAIKTVFIVTGFLWARAAYPRYRYDQLRRIGWKLLLPISISSLISIGSLLLG